VTKKQRAPPSRYQDTTKDALSSGSIYEQMHQLSQTLQVDSERLWGKAPDKSLAPMSFNPVGIHDNRPRVITPEQGNVQARIIWSTHEQTHIHAVVLMSSEIKN